MRVLVIADRNGKFFTVSLFTTDFDLEAGRQQVEQRHLVIAAAGVEAVDRHDQPIVLAHRGEIGLLAVERVVAALDARPASAAGCGSFGTPRAVTCSQTGRSPSFFTRTPRAIAAASGLITTGSLAAFCASPSTD